MNYGLNLRAPTLMHVLQTYPLRKCCEELGPQGEGRGSD
jgi:hypothetical protein